MFRPGSQRIHHTSPHMRLSNMRNFTLAYNQNQHLNKFVCEKCERVYKHRHNLIRHLRYECGVEPAFLCPRCPYKSARKAVLEYHCRNIHSLFDLKIIHSQHSNESSFSTS